MLKGVVANRELFDYLSGGASGSVKAVFSKGIYIDFSGWLIMLHDAANGTIPFGIAVKNFDGSGKNYGLEPGMSVLVNEKLLICPDRDFCVEFMFAESLINKPEISSLAAFAKKISSLDELKARSSLAVYAGGNAERLSKEDIEDIFARAAYAGLRQLENAMDVSDEMLISEALEKLIGLGRGLTPSLDDFICGMLFAMHYCENVWGLSIDFLQTLSEAVISIAPKKTNVYSAAYLQTAAKGEDFSVLRACFEWAQDDIESCINKVFDIGSSSGADMLCGMSFAANYILKHRQFTI